MAISSLVIDAMSDSLDQVVEQITAHEGVEVHGVDPTTGRIVVTIEVPGIDASKDIADSFIAIPNVINVNLVYVNVEDDLDKENEG